MPTTRTTITTALLGFAVLLAQSASAEPPKGPHGSHSGPPPAAKPAPPPSAQPAAPAAKPAAPPTAQPAAPAAKPAASAAHPTPLPSVVQVVERDPPAPPGTPMRYEQLKRLEARGALSSSEQIELSRMDAKRRAMTQAEREARLEDLRRREARLAAAERMEYERLLEIRRRNEELQRLEAERERTRLARIREAKWRAWQEGRHRHWDDRSYGEYRKHAERQAMLERYRQLAAANGEYRLVVRIDGLIAVEDQRHNDWIGRH